MHWSPPSTTHIRLFVPLLTRNKLIIRNLCAQDDTLVDVKKCHIFICVCVNAIRTILQFTLVTHGHLFGVRLSATKGTYIPIITHNILIIIVLLCRCGPYMCRYVKVDNNWPSFLYSTGRLKAHNWANWLHHPCLLGVPMVGRHQRRKRVDVVKMSTKCVKKGRNG